MKFVKYINILNGTQAATSGSNGSSSEHIYFEPSLYSGTVTCYLEIVGVSSSATATFPSGASAMLRRIGTTTDDISITSGTVNTTIQLYRSSAAIITTAQTWFLFTGFASTSTFTVKAARLVIVQDTGSNPLVATETQFEIGNRETGKVNTAAAILSAPKYYKHVAANYDGTVTGYAEVVFQGTGTMYQQTFRLQKSADFNTWTDVITIVNAATTSTTLTITRSASFTLEDGVYYRLVGFISNSMESYSVYCAKVIVIQSEGGSTNSIATWSIQGGTTSSFEMAAQSFICSKATTITGIKIKVNKNASPTDNLVVDIVTSLAGSAVATGSIAGTSLTTTLTEYEITLNTSFTPTIGVKYYIRFSRSGGADTSNYFRTGKTISTDSIEGCGYYNRNTTTWSSENADDLYFVLVGSNGVAITVGELLVANTTLAAGTALQNFLVKYDPAEWDGVTVNHVHQVDAISGNTSVVEIDTAAGSLINQSIVDSPYNVDFSGFEIYISKSTGNGSSNFGNGTTLGTAQSFVGNGMTLGNLRVNINKVGSPTGNCVAKIYAHSGTYGTSSIPTGTALATSNTLDVSSFPITGILLFNQIFNFSGANQIVLTNGTNFVFSLEYSGGDASNYLTVRTDSLGNGSGNRSTYNGSTWSSIASDICFYLSSSSPYMTMPGSAGNLDVKATTNSGNIYASKIISVIEKAAGGAMTGSMTTLSATTGTLAGSGVLSSTVATSSTLSATIHGIADITGSLAAAGSMTGDMIAVYAITANIASVSSLEANLAGAGALAATTSATGAMAATLQASGLLASNLAATSNLTGTISGIIQATATMPAVSSLSGTIQSINAITGSVTSTSTLTGTLSAGGTLASTVASVATLSGTLAGIGSISVTIASVAILSGSISGGQGMDSSIPCTSALTGTLSGKAVATSTIATQASLSSTISGSGALTGQLVTASSLSGTLTGKGALSSSLVASAVLSGTLSSGTGMQTTIACTSSLSGTLAGRANATSTITSVAVLSGSGTLRANITGNISATSLLSATITGTRNGTSALASFSSMAGSLSGSGALQSDMPAVSSIGASVNANGELVCSMDAVSVMDGTLTFTADGYMTCTIVCTSSLIHRLNYDVELLAKPSTVSTSIFSAEAGVLASITQTSYITTALQSESLLTKTLSTKSLISDTYGESNI